MRELRCHSAPDPRATEQLIFSPDQRHKSREPTLLPSRNSADGAKNGLGRRDARKRLREIQALNDYIQRAEIVVSTFRSSGLCLHGFKVNVGAKEKVVVRNLLGKPGVTAEISGNLCYAQTDQFKDSTPPRCGRTDSSLTTRPSTRRPSSHRRSTHSGVLPSNPCDEGVLDETDRPAGSAKSGVAPMACMPVIQSLHIMGYQARQFGGFGGPGYGSPAKH